MGPGRELFCATSRMSINQLASSIDSCGMPQIVVQIHTVEYLEQSGGQIMLFTNDSRLLLHYILYFVSPFLFVLLNANREPPIECPALTVNLTLSVRPRKTVGLLLDMHGQHIANGFERQPQNFSP